MCTSNPPFWFPYSLLFGVDGKVPDLRNKDLKLLCKGFIYLLMIVLPLLLHGLINDCLTLDGLMIWALLPIPSLFFGIAIGRFYRILKIPAKLFLTIFTLFFIALGVWLIEFFQLPQVYYFNHVWGYWPGPIYDEEIKVTAALFWFRASTMLWVLLLWVLPSFTKSTLHKILSLTSATAVLLIIFFIQRLAFPHLDQNYNFN